MDPKELADLVSACKAGDPGAYERLVAIYAPRLYGYLLRMVGRPDDAEELLQEVLLRLVRAMPAYRHGGQLTAFLFRIATNAVRDRYRRRRARPHQVREVDLPGDEDSGGLDEQLAGEGPPPDAAIETRQRIADLDAALARLPQEQRQVILLRHFSEMPFGQIAELLGCPVGTVLARAHRGLKRLRELLDEP